ncbi:MAG: hypothetical protein ISS71_09295 [Phycisphaerae bacterium]|nr:hypothetical protein [Phycisphaerae bacterium]
MRRRNYKYFILSVLVLCGVGLLLPLAGCTDNPENADAKEIRQEMADALKMAAQGADDETLLSAKNKVQSVLVRHQKAKGLTKDAAVLTSGNLALARGRRMQGDLDLKVPPLRNTISSFEKILRSSEGLLLEKERIEGILSGTQQEVAELEQSLNGTAQQAGLKQQLDDVQEQLNQLQNQKKQEQAQQDKTQAVLDDYQSRADGLLRKAELAGGDEKLKLQKEAYAILKDRKEYYIEVQASENKITALDDQIELVQSQVDGLEQSIQETQQRIDAIGTSRTQIGLKQQLREAEQTLSVNQQQLAGVAERITNELDVFRNESQAVCGVLEEAVAEFEKVRSRDANFTASLQLAESYHQAALVCSASIRVQMDTSERLEDLLAMADPAFADLLEGKLPIVMTIEATESQRAMDFYDKSIEAYQKAFDAAGEIGQDAQCSVLKSQLLAVDSKKKLAYRLNLLNIAEQAETQVNELMEKGQEYGVSFTQSETRKLVEFGIDYTPSLPVNLEVLAEESESRLSAWKRLPLAEQEEAVAANLIEIDELIARYGEALAQKLEPLKQDMLDAQQRGFEAPAPGSTFGEPNSI